MNKMLMVGTGVGTTPILGGKTIKDFNQLIKALFAKGEKGFFYDPNDLTTMFRDSAGTIPVTGAGQPVGLILDKSKGLKIGSELFTQFNSTLNSTLSQNTLPCVVTSTVSSSVFGVAAVNLFQEGLYKIEFAWSGNTSQADIGIQLPNGNNLSLGTGVTGSFSKVMNFTSAGSFSVTNFTSKVGQTFTVDALSVKKIAGNHAYQTTSAARPILQQTPILGSELVVNGSFSTNDFTGWVHPDTAPSATTVANKQVTMTAAVNLPTALARLRQAVSVSAGEYVVSVNVVSITATPLASVALGNATNGDAAYGTIPFNRVGKFEQKITVSSGTLGLAFTAGSMGGGTIVIDDISVRRVSGYITDQNYLLFDGTDDFLVTNSIDFTATDKVSLFTGVRKLSDALVGTIAEFSVNTNNNAGSFWLISPLSANANSVSFASRGSAPTVASIGYLYAPTSAVLRGVGDISGDNASVYVNANLGDKRVTNQGTGNYGNYPLYIGRRGGTTLPFTGHIYSLIGVGRLTTDRETAAIEKELAKRTGVTLNV